MASASPAFGAAARRDLFLLAPGDVPLNHGSFGVVPKPVRAAQIALLDKVEENPDTFFRDTAWDVINASRAAIAELLDGDADGVVFTTNATTGVNAVLGSLRLNPGNVVLYFARVIYFACEQALLRECERRGATAVALHVPLLNATPDDYALAVEGALRTHGGHVRMLLVDHIISGTAAHVPLEELVPRVRAASAVFGAVDLAICVDGAHAPGMLALSLRSMSALGVDVYIGNLHKWCFVPKSVAVVYSSPSARAWVRPCVVSHNYGRGYTAEFDQQGTIDVVPIATIPAALAFVESLGGWTAVRAYQRELLARGTALLAERTGAEVFHADKGTMALLRMPALGALADLDASPAAATRVMDVMRRALRITLPVWSHDGALFFRVSAQVYVTLEDFGRLADALVGLGAPLAADEPFEARVAAILSARR